MSSDSIIIDGKNNIYIYDVGNNETMAKEINSLTKKKIIIISHFHKDHLKNLNKINYQQLYVGDNTYRYTKKGIVVDEKIELEDGVELFKLSSSHAKGSIAMKFKDFVFVGDAVSHEIKNNKCLYNVQKLKEEIDTLDSLDVKYIVFSHNAKNYKTKEEVLDKLKTIYSKRIKNSPFIEI